MYDSNVMDFPIERYFPIQDCHDLLLRLTIGTHNDKFWVEADLVSKEGRKILNHLGFRDGQDNLHDATQKGLSLYYDP